MKDGKIVLARAYSARTRQPSFSMSTQTLHTSTAFAWDVNEQGFCFGHMGGYDFSYKWKAVTPCNVVVATDIL